MDQKSLIRIIDTILRKRLKPMIKELVKEEVKNQVINILLETQNGGKRSNTMLSQIDDEYEEYQEEQVLPKRQKHITSEHSGPRVQLDGQFNKIDSANSQFITSDNHEEFLQQQPQRPVKREKKNFTKNTVINDIMNQIDHDPNFEATQFEEGQPVITNNNQRIVPEGANPIFEHVPRDISGLPPFLQDAFTKNYSGVIKASEDKTKQRRGMI